MNPSFYSISRHCRWLGAVLVCLSIATVTACGGGSDDNSPEESTNSQTMKHGAIAYGQSGSIFNVGSAANATTQEAAVDKAMGACGRAYCAVVLEFNDCGAFVVGKNASGSFVWGTASGPSANAAQKAAESSCAGKGGLGCQLGNMKPICNAN